MNYDDIINLPRHISKKHPPMSREARSAQFAPFAALTGYADDVKETERYTTQREEIDENQKEILNRELKGIIKNIDKAPKILITYFVPDFKKSGGKYVTVVENVKKVDEYKNIIILESGIKIPITEIVDIRENI